MTEAVPNFPLICRAPDAPLFLSSGETITAAMFLDAAHRLAQDLPDGVFVVNLCRDRLWFAVAFAAAMLRRQVSLLTSDRTSAGLQEFPDRFPDLYVLADEPVPALPLRCHVLRRFPLLPVAHDPPNPAIPASQLAAIVFTSGSTGQPVAHNKPWGTLVQRSIDAAAFLELTDQRTTNIVGMVPPQHMYGFETTILLPMHVPAAAWCGAAFYPEDVAEALRVVPEPRILVTSPLQIGALLRASINLPPVDRIISATAPLFPETAKAAEQCWNTRVFEIFGATEVGSIAGRRTVEGDVWTTYRQVRLTPSPLDDEQAGTEVSGPFAEPCRLSDLIDLLDDRHFRLIGRRADMVKLGGRRASLADLNRILAGIDGVLDGQFIAPDDLDRQPTARLLVLAVAPAMDADDILAELRNRIDPLFLPRRVILVDELPRNDIGKLTEHAVGLLRARLGGI